MQGNLSGINATVVTPYNVEYYDIESDFDSYIEESKSIGEETDEDLKEMSNEEEEDMKYLSIFENECNDFDEKVMTLDCFDELKKWRWL